MAWPEAELAYDHSLRRDEAAFPVANVGCAHFAPVRTDLGALDAAEGCIFSLLPRPISRVEASIHVLLRSVVLLFKEGRPRLATKVELTSDALLANGVADFVIKRGNKKVIVMVAKKQDYDQATAELLVLMDIAVSNSIKDGIPSDHVYGIVADYVQWDFFQRSASVIPFCTRLFPQTTRKIASRWWRTDCMESFTIDLVAKVSARNFWWHWMHTNCMF